MSVAVGASAIPMAETGKNAQIASSYPTWFYLPAAIIYGVLFLFPTIASLFFSLTRWTLFEAQFIGLENFVQFFREPFLVQGLVNTLIYGVSDVAEPHLHLMTNYHIVLIGKAGGKVAGNRYVRMPGRKVTELVLTMQQALGMNVQSWGSWDKTSKTIPEILT